MKAHKQKAKGLVYFMRRSDGVGAIKIGCSKLPRSRLAAMQVWSPEKLEIVAAVPGTFADEARLHRQFDAYRLHGEWFEAAPAILAAMARASTLGELPPKPASDRNVRIMARYAAGDTYEAIAADFGVTRQRIEQIIRKEGGAPRGHVGKRTCPAWDRVNEIRSLAESGVSTRDIAERVGDTYGNVLRVCHDAGIVIHRIKRERSPATVERALEIARDYGSGLKTTEIAEKHGIQQPHVFAYLRIAGVKPNRLGGVKPRSFDVSLILPAYKDGATLSELAAAHGVSIPTIRGALSRANALRTAAENEAIRIARVCKSNRTRNRSDRAKAA